MKRYIALIMILLAGVGCKKIIDIDYPSADKVYVIEASICDTSNLILITQTSDMDVALDTTPITSATISMSNSQGEILDFEADSLGYYQPLQELSLTQGQEYTLSVQIDQQSFTSSSVLCAKPEISDINFSVYQYTSDKNLVFCTFKIQDPLGEQNYYRYRFRYFANDNEETGEPSWWLTKETVDGEGITLMTNLYPYNDRDIQDADEVSIEVQSIDKAAYDYFYSLNNSDSTNPISNFTGDCLGYFYVYSQSVADTVFYY